MILNIKMGKRKRPSESSEAFYIADVSPLCHRSDVFDVAEATPPQ